jgi:hypothetical protein
MTQALYANMNNKRKKKTEKKKKEEDISIKKKRKRKPLESVVLTQWSLGNSDKILGGARRMSIHVIQVAEDT